MSRVRLIDKIFSAVITAVITTLMLGFLLLWITAEEPDVEDDAFTVTVEYDCRVVIVQPEDFPEQVIEECRNKFRFKNSKQTPMV